MKKKNKFAGTLKELATFLSKEVDKNRPGRTKFKSVSFAVDESGSDDIEYAVSAAEGWYGIHQVETGFDDDESLTLCCNYYGGGYPFFGHIFEGLGEEGIQHTLLSMMRDALRHGENIRNPDSCRVVAEIKTTPLTLDDRIRMAFPDKFRTGELSYESVPFGKPALVRRTKRHTFSIRERRALDGKLWFVVEGIHNNPIISNRVFVSKHTNLRDAKIALCLTKIGG